MSVEFELVRLQKCGAGTVPTPKKLKTKAAHEIIDNSGHMAWGRLLCTYTGSCLTGAILPTRGGKVREA